MEQTVKAFAPAPAAWTPAWGFGAPGAAKKWTTPATATVPEGWWKQDKSWVAA